MNITVRSLNLVCFKTFSPILGIKTTGLNDLSKLSERSKCPECQLKLVATESGIERDDYLQLLSPGGTPSIALRDFIFQTFSIIEFISPTIKNIAKNANVPSVSKRLLLNPGYSTNIAIFTKNGVKNLPPRL